MSAELAYLFRHSVMREVAYGLQLPSERAELHLAAYRAFESEPDDVLERHATELADHAHFAGEYVKGELQTELGKGEAKWLAIAAQQAKKRSDMGQAADLFLRLGRCAGATKQQRARAMLDAALAASYGREREHALEILRQTDVLVRDCDDNLLIADLLLARVEIEVLPVRTYLPGYTLVEEAEARYTKVNDLRGLARCMGFRGNLALRAEDLDLAEKCYQQSIELFRELGNEQGITTSLGNLALVFKYRDDVAEAERLLREALSLDRKLGNPQGIGRHLGNLANIAIQQGRYDEGESLCNQAEEVVRKTGDRQALVKVNFSFGQLHMHRKQYHKAISLFDQMARSARESGLVVDEADALAFRGECLLELDDTVRGESVLLDALHLYEMIGRSWSVAETCAVLAESAMKRGDSDTAKRYAKQGMLHAEDDPKLTQRLSVVLTTVAQFGV